MKDEESKPVAGQAPGAPWGRQPRKERLLAHVDAKAKIMAAEGASAAAE